MRIPNLFPNFRNYRTRDARRRYVEETMVELAQVDHLYLTHLLRQEAPIPDLVSEVILGRRLDLQTERVVSDVPVPIEIDDYEVKIESLHGQPFSFTLGMRPASEQYVGRRGASTSAQRLEPHIVRVPYSVATMPLRYALYLLKQSGEWVAPARSSQARKALWRVREVPPAGIKIEMGEDRATETVLAGIRPADDSGAELEIFDASGASEAAPVKRGRGRPKGSKTKRISDDAMRGAE